MITSHNIQTDTLMDHMPKEKMDYFKKRLEEEQAKLVDELKSLGYSDPDEGGQWEPAPEKLDIMEADKNEAADRLEEAGDNAAIMQPLEFRLNRVKRAMEKIEAGTYGRCEVSGEPIPMERLEANPAALTTVEHEGGLHG